MLLLRQLCVIALTLFFAAGAYSYVCVSITQPLEWDSVKMEKDSNYYFTTRINNSMSSGGYCEPGEYEISLSLDKQEISFGDIFDWNANPKRMLLNNNESRQVLLTLSPKVSTGKFIVFITAKRFAAGSEGGTKIISSSIARMKVTIGDGSDLKFTELPFWVVRKDCPGGFVVKQGEECPRPCADGSPAVNGVCPEDSAGNLSPGAGPGENQPPGTIERLVPVLPMEILSIIIAVVVVLGAAVAGMFIYIRRLKQQLGGGGRWRLR